MQFPAIFSTQLGCVKRYKPPPLKFVSQVPMDGRKQADFTQEMLHVVQKQVKEWLELGAVEQVSYQPKYISLLLVVPNEKKVGFTICQYLRMLNSIVSKI